MLLCKTRNVKLECMTRKTKTMFIKKNCINLTEKCLLYPNKNSVCNKICKSERIKFVLQYQIIFFFIKLSHNLWNSRRYEQQFVLLKNTSTHDTQRYLKQFFNIPSHNERLGRLEKP